MGNGEPEAMRERCSIKIKVACSLEQSESLGHQNVPT